MKFLATLFVLMIGGWATAADPTLEITATGTTNNNNKVVITFEVKNLPAGKGIVSIAQMKINGVAVPVGTRVLQFQGANGAIKVTTTLPAGKVPVELTINLSGGLDPVSQTKEVDLMMMMEEPIPDPLPGGGT